MENGEEEAGSKQIENNSAGDRTGAKDIQLYTDREKNRDKSFNSLVNCYRTEKQTKEKRDGKQNRK